MQRWQDIHSLKKSVPPYSLLELAAFFSPLAASPLLLQRARFPMSLNENSLLGLTLLGTR